MNVPEAMAEKEYLEKIKKSIKKNNLEKNVIFLATQTFEQHINNFAKARVVVVAEQWENMAPTIIIEALSLGRAVVASRIGGIPEMITHEANGLLANFYDHNDFAKQITRLISDNALYAKIIKNAKISSQKIASIKTVQKQMTNLYDFVLAK